ncbi:MAG: M23 family metallopeptidase, partial [Fibrobacter sp.]|nr:M23 family metallopeptidase [Fibrobacter sp.]
PDDPVAQTSQKAEVEVPDAEVAKEREEVVEEKPEVIEFAAPVSGKVIEEYSGDDLVYNEALKDWRAHSGVDFEAKIGEEVKASAKGIIESVFDSNMGRCVIIDHQNGFRTMYANLEETETVKEGDQVMAGRSD